MTGANDYMRLFGFCQTEPSRETPRPDCDAAPREFPAHAHLCLLRPPCLLSVPSASSLPLPLARSLPVRPRAPLHGQLWLLVLHLLRQERSPCLPVGLVRVQVRVIKKLSWGFVPCGYAIATQC